MFRNFKNVLCFLYCVHNGSSCGKGSYDYCTFLKKPVFYATVVGLFKNDFSCLQLLTVGALLEILISLFFLAEEFSHQIMTNENHFEFL
jgi:hypothetical protein